MSRVLEFEGIRNFRHFGEYAACDGAKVRANLFRSGHFHNATEADKSRLADLNISVVADLRRPRERENEPSSWGEGLRILQSDVAGHAEPPHLQFLREGDLSREGVTGFMRSAYQRLPNEKGNQEVFAAGLRELATHGADEGFVVHCAAGKDRTGIFCALALSLADVGKDDIYDDYLMTNTAVDYDTLIPVVQKRLKDMFGRDVKEDVMKVFLGVDEEFLDVAFQEIGSAERYARDVLGLSDDEIAAVRTNLIAG
ncbi:tyrosine-protein phosphatase [Hyphobacterium sp.]|uniref:tyrosine-protein phosphatase n=1 Tax=Hyphobacterium sp. TaxID=2004662 RepID=UPI003BA854C1